MKAACSGCSSLAVGEPLDRRDLGAVVRDGEREAGVRAAAVDQDVQAPHWPWSQPFFAPVSPRCSRSTSSSVVRVSTVSWCSAPLMRERDLGVHRGVRLPRDRGRYRRRTKRGSQTTCRQVKRRVLNPIIE